MRNTWKGILTPSHQNFKKHFPNEKAPATQLLFSFSSSKQAYKQTKTQIFQLDKKTWAPNSRHFNQWLLPGYKRLGGYRFELMGVRHWCFDTQNKNCCSVGLMSELFMVLLQLSFSLPCEMWRQLHTLHVVLRKRPSINTTKEKKMVSLYPNLGM